MLPEEFQTDKKIVKIAVRQNLQSLRYAHKSLKRDESFTNSIFKENRIDTLDGKLDALGISNADRSFINYLKKKDKSHLIPIALRLSFGEGIVKELKHASLEVRNNEEFMLAASEVDVKALEAASEELKNNQEFMLTAAKTNICAIEYANAGSAKQVRLASAYCSPR